MTSMSIPHLHASAKLPPENVSWCMQDFEPAGKLSSRIPNQTAVSSNVRDPCLGRKAGEDSDLTVVGVYSACSTENMPNPARSDSNLFRARVLVENQLG